MAWSGTSLCSRPPRSCSQDFRPRLELYRQLSWFSAFLTWTKLLEPLAFPGFQLGHCRLRDFSASIVAWANTLSYIHIYMLLVLFIWITMVNILYIYLSSSQVKCETLRKQSCHFHLYISLIYLHCTKRMSLNGCFIIVLGSKKVDPTYPTHISIFFANSPNIYSST